MGQEERNTVVTVTKASRSGAEAARLAVPQFPCLCPKAVGPLREPRTIVQRRLCHRGQMELGRNPAWYPLQDGTPRLRVETELPKFTTLTRGEAPVSRLQARKPRQASVVI